MGIKNLFNIYIPECEYWMIIDNSYTPVLICEGGKDITTKIHNKTLFNQLINYERTRISGTQRKYSKRIKCFISEISQREEEN